MWPQTGSKWRDSFSWQDFFPWNFRNCSLILWQSLTFWGFSDKRSPWILVQCHRNVHKFQETFTQTSGDRKACTEWWRRLETFSLSDQTRILQWPHHHYKWTTPEPAPIHPQGQPYPAMPWPHWPMALGHMKCSDQMTGRFHCGRPLHTAHTYTALWCVQITNKQQWTAFPRLPTVLELCL